MLFNEPSRRDKTHVMGSTVCSTQPMTCSDLLLLAT